MFVITKNGQEHVNTNQLLHCHRILLVFIVIYNQKIQYCLSNLAFVKFSFCASKTAAAVAAAAACCCCCCYCCCCYCCYCCCCCYCCYCYLLLLLLLLLLPCQGLLIFPLMWSRSWLQTVTYIIVNSRLAVSVNHGDRFPQDMPISCDLTQHST